MSGPFEKVSLRSNFRDPAQVREFFSHVDRWKIDRLIMLITDWNRHPGKDFMRGQLVPENPLNWRGPDQNWLSYPFGAKAMPALVKYQHEDEIRAQLEITDAVYEECLKHNVGFELMLFVPKFIFNDKKTVSREFPELFDENGLFQLAHPAYFPLLKGILDEMHARYPKMAGFEIWIAEGAGPSVHFFGIDDLNSVNEWLPMWAAFFDSYGKQHNLDMKIFAHQFLSSQKVKHEIHAIMAGFPNLSILEDITWPAEQPSLPYLGFLGEDYAKKVASQNPMDINFLLDTEFIGQGRIPCVLPEWWQGGIQACRAAGAKEVSGRVMFWDDYGTLEGWNLLNVDLFCELARDPEQKIRPLLEKVTAERFSKEAAGPLCDCLEQAQRVLILGHGINGYDITTHSAFPSHEFLNEHYCPHPLCTRSINDLYEPPGTRLFGALDDNIMAGRQWRYQMRTITRSPEDYLKEKDIAISLLEDMCAKVETLRKDLLPKDAEFVELSFKIWLAFVKGMRLCVEAAQAHVEWMRDDCAANGALEELNKIGGKMEKAADDFSIHFGEEALFRCAKNMRKLAGFLKDPDPIHKKGSNRL